MATTYSVADPTVFEVVAGRVAAAHADMADAGVRFGVLFAYNPGRPAVRHGGYPAAAVVRLVPQKDRVTKGFDAEIVIDQNVWGELSPRQRLALVAHELRHVRLVRKEQNGILRVQLDDCGRPKLRLAPGDWSGGDGFSDIVAEFGQDSLEHRTARHVWAKADGAEKRGPDADLFTPGRQPG